MTQNSINTSYTLGSNRELAQPRQPLFLANLSADAADVTGDGTAYTLICDTEIYDQNADYNNASGIMTAPVTGIYTYSVTTTLGDLAAAATLNSIGVVTTDETFETCLWNPGFCSDGSAGQLLSSYSVIKPRMDAGDTAYVSIKISNATKVVDVIGNANCPTTFSGYLVC